jgi:thioredoxin reductase
MTEQHYDVIVFGGGPAGLNAALATDAAGLRTVVIDEQHGPGGQVYRPVAGELTVVGRPDPQYRSGERLRERVRASGVTVLSATRVWGATRGFKVYAATVEDVFSLTGDAVLIASGATERVIPFRGWTTPGVIGLAAATILLKSHRTLPGRRTVVAGAGPLLPAVAAGILKMGGEVSAIVDSQGPATWMGAALHYCSSPKIFALGLGWVLSLGARHIPYYSYSKVTAAEGIDAVSGVEVSRIGKDEKAIAGTASPIACDALAVGNGLVPSIELASLLQVEMTFDERCRSSVPKTDECGRTSIAGIYAAGDCTGIHGADHARLAGELTGLAIACDRGRLPQAEFEQRAARLRPAIRRAGKIGAASARLMTPADAAIADVPADAVICRCEDVAYGDFIASLRQVGSDMNALKAWTRCGMGPCQGRTCGPNVRAAARLHCGVEPQALLWTARAPVRPLDLAGAAEYQWTPNEREFN